ncbi:MAG: lipopolysaccharide biosynthesis protein [Saprospiraceae bacterium]|nr:lipopolysaccharide biosynthesis protein [Saprospiraceae bacterium]
MPSNSLHSATRRSFSAALLAAAMGLGQVIVLAHLLPKSELALAALSSVWVGLAAQLQEGGVNAAVIQHPQTPHNALSTLYWFNLLQGAVLWALVALSGWGMAHFYGESQLASLTIVYAATLFVGGFGAQYKVLLQKNFRFDWLTRIEVIGAATALFVSCGLAWRGWEAWALILGYLVRQLMETILLIAAGRPLFRPAPVWRPEEAKPWFSSGFSHFGERLTTHFVGQLDTLLIGKFWGVEALGVYDTFRRIVFRPAVLIAGAAEKVAFPLLSKLQSRPLYLRKAYLGLLNGLNTLLFPAYVLAILLAAPIVGFVFGATWVPYTAVFQWLCLSAMVATQLNPVDSLLLAKGKIHLWQRAGMAQGVLTLVALAIVAGQQLVFAAAALTIVQGLLCAFVFLKILPEELGMAIGDFNKAVLRPALFCGFAALPLIASYNRSLGMAHVLGILLFLVLYGFGVRRWNREIYKWLLSLLKRKPC